MITTADAPSPLTSHSADERRARFPGARVEASDQTRRLRLLLVEDVELDAQLIILAAHEGSPEPIWRRVETAGQMHAALDDGLWDAVIADYTLPRFSMLDALALTQQRGDDLPFIVVSGTMGETAAVAAMKAGAHDYLMKDNLARLGVTLAREVREAGERRARRVAEAALQQREEQYRTVLEASFNGIITTDLGGRITSANNQLAHLLGYDTPTDLIGLSGHELIHAEDRSRAAANVERVLATGRMSCVRVRMVRRDGSEAVVESNAAAITNAADEPVAVMVAIQDVTDRSVYEDRLRHQAVHDALTGLPNRTLLLDRLQHELLVSHRANTPMVLMLLDLNNFKEINDTLGHATGDTLLSRVSERLCRAVREVDTVARLGGDEFAVVLPHADEVIAVEIAKRLQTELAHPFVIDGHHLRVEMSTGIVLVTAGGATPTALLRQADVAMYEAKRARLPHVVHTVENDPHSTARLAPI